MVVVVDVVMVVVVVEEPPEVLLDINLSQGTGFYKKLDQGALGMSDPLGPRQLALKPNSASSINRPLLNFYYCAH